MTENRILYEETNPGHLKNPGASSIPSEKSPSGLTLRTPPSIERIKSKFMKITGVNVFETSDRSTPDVRRHPRRSSRRFGGKRFRSCGDPSRRSTRSYCGPLTTLGSAKCGRRDGNIEKVLNSRQELAVNESFDLGTQRWC